MEKRITFWDNLKFLLIIFMVIGHLAYEFTDISKTARFLYLSIYSFHMPLFIFISGLFHKSDKFKQHILFYISIGFSQKMFNVLLAFLFHESIHFKLLSDGGIPWFMFVLAIYTLLAELLKDQNHTYLILAFVCLACFITYDSSINDYLYLSRTIVFFPFYLLGVICQPEKCLVIKQKFFLQGKILTSIFLTVILFLFYFKLNSFYPFRYLFTGRAISPEQFNDYNPLHRLFCYGLTICMSLSIMALVPIKHLTGISHWGRKTINVLFYHWPLIKIIGHFISFKQLYQHPIGMVSYYLIAILISILLSQKIFDYPILWIRKQIFTTKK
ncbi:MULTISPECIES: acyltransferase family protein [Terrabacteria group]|uniref:acyltransferase family protein n=1 Tax=Bacillati TaxID=1783272 RepID=UPI001C6E7193|nr:MULTISPECIES: acyltransferase family protein [Terrabacteria group]MBW9211938.1 hypothetical protein [Trueperella sp. zg.1013]